MQTEEEMNIKIDNLYPKRLSRPNTQFWINFPPEKKSTTSLSLSLRTCLPARKPEHQFAFDNEQLECASRLNFPLSCARKVGKKKKMMKFFQLSLSLSLSLCLQVAWKTIIMVRRDFSSQAVCVRQIARINCKATLFWAAHLLLFGWSVFAGCLHWRTLLFVDFVQSLRFKLM